MPMANLYAKDCICPEISIKKEDFIALILLSVLIFFCLFK